MFHFNDYNENEFDEHISKSIPNYLGMRNMIPHIIKNFAIPNTNVYDLGTSSGSLLKELSIALKDDTLSYVGYDIADKLIPKDSNPNINFFVRDVTEDSLTFFNTSAILSVFTLQFINLDKRVQLVNKVYNSLSKRGVFLVCEKIYSDVGQVEDIFTFTNYAMKFNNGFTTEEILQKQHDLKSIMYPLSQKDNEKMFREAGFEIVEVFFKSLNFTGWLLIK
jgi:tRNA (cmo5U34)-methyltransferase